MTKKILSQYVSLSKTTSNARWISMQRLTIIPFLVFILGFVTATGQVSNPNFSKKKVYDIPYEGKITDVSKVFASISTLKGIQYYSNTRERWETLYTEAGFINNSKDKKFIADNAISIKQSADYYCLLEDNSLGDCVFKINYTENDNEVTANLILIEPISIWGITGVQANDLYIQLRANKVQDAIHVEIKIDARYREISFIEDLLPKSLDARMEALFRWIKKELSKNN